MVAEFVRTSEKFKHTKKVIPKFIYFFICKVQGVLKTDQGAGVSAHAFFSAHEKKKQHHTYIGTITNYWQLILMRDNCHANNFPLQKNARSIS